MMWLRTPLLGLARWVWLAIVATLVVFAAWWLVTSLTGDKTAKTEAKLSENQAEAAMESGTDAVETMGKTIEYERHVDYITRENDRAYQSAPGSGALIDPELTGLARQRLCQRAAYSEHPDCLLNAPPE